MAILYLDPGTGSLILQVLAAAVLTAWFTTKTFVYRMKRFFARIRAKSDYDESE